MSRAPATTVEGPGPRTGRTGDYGWPVAILVVGLVLRLAYVLEFSAHPLGKLPWVDEGAYWSRALEIRAGAWLPDRPFYQDPLFSYALGGLMSVAGSDVATLRVVLACLGALTPVAVYWAGLRGLGKAQAIIAGLLCAACGPLIFADGLLEKEGLAALLAALALGLTAIGLELQARTAWPAASGLCWGGVALLRANALALGPLGTLFWAFADARRVTGRRRLLRAGAFVVGLLVAIAPVSVINALRSRPTELILTTWQGGANFYIGNGPEATGTYVAPEFVEANPAREADDFAAEAARRAGRPLRYAAVSRFWLGQGLKRWRDAPAASLRLFARKLGLVLHNFEIPDNQDIQFVRIVAAPALGWGVVSFGLLLPLAALGAARSERSPFLGFLVLSTVTGLVTTAAFFVVGRYRTPWIPGLSLLAAAGAVDLFRRLADRRWASAAGRVLVVAVPAALVAWRPMPDPTPDRWGHSQIALGLAYLAEASLEPAIDAFDDARAIGPGPALRIQAVSETPGIQERINALVETRLSFSRRGPAIPDINRARWLRQLVPRRNESRELLQSLLRREPQSAPVLREWGAWWLGETANPDARREAQSALERASEQRNIDPSAAILLALLTSDPRHLDRVPESGRARVSRRAGLVRAIISSRKGVGMNVY